MVRSKRKPKEGNQSMLKAFFKWYRVVLGYKSWRK